MVEFSIPMRTWTWTCEMGHHAFDFESEWEATQDFLNHECQLR